MDTERINKYFTSEFPLAVALLCMDVKLEGLRPHKEDPQRIEFIFGKDEQLENLVFDYWESNLFVDPKVFWNHCRELKSRIKAGI